MGHSFVAWAADRLRVQKGAGAQGLKIWKPFGLHVKDQDGQLVKVDDPRLIAIWEAAGELKLPVLIHVADPVAFFDPIDATNERWEELGAHPAGADPGRGATRGIKERGVDLAHRGVGFLEQLLLGRRDHFLEKIRDSFPVIFGTDLA